MAKDKKFKWVLSVHCIDEYSERAIYADNWFDLIETLVHWVGKKDDWESNQDRKIIITTELIKKSEWDELEDVVDFKV